MLNVAVIMGRLTADPELRTTLSGVSVTSFTVAVDRNYSKPGEERQADFLCVVAWRSVAEFVCKYFQKGQMIAIEGSIQTRRYEDKSGATRTATEIVAENISFCGSKEHTTQEKPMDTDEKPRLNMGAVDIDADDEPSLLDDDLPF